MHRRVPSSTYHDMKPRKSRTRRQPSLPIGSPRRTTTTSGTSWRDYEHLFTPLPEVQLNPKRRPFKYFRDVSALMGTGALPLAEAALLQLRHLDPWFNEQLAHLYSSTGRLSEARSALDELNRNLDDDSPNRRTYDTLPGPVDPRMVI